MLSVAFSWDDADLDGCFDLIIQWAFYLLPFLFGDRDVSTTDRMDFPIVLVVQILSSS